MISSTLVTIDFVGLPTLLRIIYNGLPWKPCIFTKPITIYFLDIFVLHLRVPINNLAPLKIVMGCKVGLIRCRGNIYVGYADCKQMLYFSCD